MATKEEVWGALLKQICIQRYLHHEKKVIHFYLSPIYVKFKNRNFSLDCRMLWLVWIKSQSMSVPQLNPNLHQLRKFIDLVKPMFLSQHTLYQIYICIINTRTNVLSVLSFSTEFVIECFTFYL